MTSTEHREHDGHDGHDDECATPAHAQAEEHADHRHGPGCGHDSVPHGDHEDYLHDGHRHAAHEDHFDEH